MDYVIRTLPQLSTHLRALRKTRGFSQAELGLRLGVGQTRVARIEGNPTVISVEQLLDVLGALGVQMVLQDVHGSRRESTADSAPKRAITRPRKTGGEW